MKAFTAPSYSPFVPSRTNIVRFGAILSLFSYLLLASAGQSWAQFQKPDVAMPSPNAASLGLYGEVPVSLHTGTPNINIPLYTLQEGDINLPIGLSYHASGVRVNQHPGWVGLNWNLNTGGAITRTVKGGVDEFKAADATSANYAFANGYLTSKNALNDPDWDKKENIQTKISPDVDLEPDEFSFNFLGYSGKFFLSENGQWLVQCDESIKVNMLSGNLPIPDNMNIEKQWPGFPFRTGKPYANSIKGFELITPNGTKYTFGGNTDAIEYSIPFFDQLNGQWIANTWNITKIESPEGNTIAYTYEVQPEGQGKFVASFYYSLQNETSSGQLIYADPGNNSFLTLVRTVLIVPYIIHSLSGTNNDVSTTCMMDNTGVPQSGIFAGNLIRPTYLKSITGSTFELDFEVDNTQELQYSTRIIDKYIDFIGYEKLTFYNLFRAKDDFCLNCSDLDFKVKIMSQLKWKKLKSLKLYNKINTASPVQQYSINYNEDNTKRLMLMGIDQVSNEVASCKNNWTFAYYQNGTIKLPTYLDPSDQTDHWGFFNADSYPINNGINQAYITHKEASADINVLQEGTLNKITYPSGGYTQLNYEPHSCYKYAKIAADGTNQLENGTGQKIGGIRIKSITAFDGTTTSTKVYDYTFNGLSSGILSGKHEYLSQINVNFNVNGSLQTAQRQVFSVQNVLPLSQNSLGNIVGYRQVKETLGDGSYTLYSFTNYESTDGNHFDENIPAYSRTQPYTGRYEKRTDLSTERGRLLNEIKYDKNSVKVYEKKVTFDRLSTEFARSVSASAERICDSYVTYNYGYAYKNYTFKYKPVKEELWTYEQANQNKVAYQATTYTYNSIGLPTATKQTQNGRISTSINKYASDYTFADGCFAQYQNCQASCSSGDRDQYGNCISGCRAQYNSCISSKTYDEASKAIQLMQMTGMTGMLVEQQKWNNDNGTLGMVDGFINQYRSYAANPAFVNIQPEQTLQYAVAVPNPAPVTSSIQAQSVNNFYFRYDPAYKKVVVRFNDPSNAYTLRGEPVQFTDVNNLTTAFTYYAGAKTGLVASKVVGNQRVVYDYNPLVGLTLMTDANSLQTKYGYDGFNRLVTIRDNWNNLLQANAYNLASSTGCTTARLNPETPVSSTLVPTTVTPATSLTGCFTITNAKSTLLAYATPNNLVQFLSEGSSGTRPNGNIWKLEAINSQAPYQYKITSQVDNLGKVITSPTLANGDPIEVNSYANDANHNWTLEVSTGGVYRVQSNQKTWDQADYSTSPQLQIYGDDNSGSPNYDTVYRLFYFASATCPASNPGVAGSLSISPSGTQSVASVAGSQSVTVTASNTTWMATSNASWLTLSGANNSAMSGVVTASYTANPDATSRSATLTVGGTNGVVNQMLVFTQQPAINQMACTGTGGIGYERWYNINGTAVSDLTNSSHYNNDPADVTAIQNDFRAPTNVGDHYGARIRGYICPPVTGLYTFWIAGDDNVSLRLNKTGPDPAGAIEIAGHTSWTDTLQWNKFTSQRSAAIQLTAGQRYYVEALLKEEMGGDNLAVGWRTPTDNQTTLPDGSLPIPGAYLIPFNSTASVAGSLSISPSGTQSVASAAGSQPVTVTASNTTWTASTNASWLTINGPYTGSNSGVVTVTYAANPGATSRSAILTVGGTNGVANQILVFMQAAGSATCQLAASSTPYTISAGQGSVLSVVGGGSSASYTWKSNGNTVGAGSSITVYPTATATYSVECSSCNSCLSASTQVVINNATPTADVNKKYIGVVYAGVAYPNDLTVWQTRIDTALANGVNLVEVIAEWNSLKRGDNPIDWTIFDGQIEYLRNKKYNGYPDLRVWVRISTARQWSYNQMGSFLNDSEDSMVDQYGQLCADHGNLTSLSLDSERATQQAENWVHTVTSHINAPNLQPLVLGVSVVNSSIYETEYRQSAEANRSAMDGAEQAKLFDYSLFSKSKFKSRLANWFNNNIAQLNTYLDGTNYTNFASVEPPVNASNYPEAVFLSKLGKLWYWHRHLSLKEWMNRMVTQVRLVNPNFENRVEFGSNFDDGSARRGTFGSADISEGIAGIKVNCAPNNSFEQKFATALALRDRSPEKWASQEVDNGGTYASNIQPSIDHIITADRAGCRMIVVFSAQVNVLGSILRGANVKYLLSQPVYRPTPASSVNFSVKERLSVDLGNSSSYNAWKQAAGTDYNTPVQINQINDVLPDGLAGNCNVSAPGISASGTSVCNTAVTLTATGCAGGTVTWSNNSTGSAITVTTAGFYTATCSANNCTSSPSAGITLTGCGSTGTGACASSISQIRYQTDAGNNGMGIYVTTTGVTPQFQLGKPDGTTLAWQDMPLTATTGLFLWAQAGQPRGTYTLSVRPANEPGSVCTYSFNFGATNADAILYPTGNCNVSAPGISASGTSVCNTAVTLTATGCAGGTVTWSNNSTGSAITVTTAGFYTATCSANNCTSSPSAGITLTGCGSTGTGACASSISQIRYQTDAGNNGMGIYVTTTGVTPQFQLGKPDGTTLAWQDMPLTATTGLFLWAQAGQPRGTYTLSVRPANEPGSVCTYSFSFGATNADAILYPTGNSGGTGTGTNNGTGLLGTYFNSVDLTSSPVLSRVDATINFTWDAAGPSPASGVNPTNMSVRWEGQVEAPVTGTYTFKTNNDDATRLWINGQQLINDWPGGHPPTVYQGTISLQAGQKYTIKYEFNQGGGGAQAQLSWSYPGQAEQIVPQGRLYPGSGGSTGTGACASSISQIRYQTDAGNNGMGIYVTTTGVTPQFQLGKPDGTTLAWQDMPLTATTGLFLWAQAGQPRGTYTLSVRPANEPGSVCTYSFNFGATNADAILYPTGNCNVSAPGISASGTSVCNTAVTLTATGCAGGTVTWSNNSTGSAITVTTAGFYTATCSANNCTSSPSAGITLTGCGSTGTGACASSISQIRYQTDAGNNGMGIYVTTTGVTPQFQLGKPDGTTLAWQDMPLTATTGLFLWAQAGQPRGTYTLSVRPANEPGSVCTYSFNFGATNADAILYPTGNCNVSAPGISASGTSVCNTAVTLTATGCAGGTVTWSNNSTGSAITVTTAGFYTATCSANNCTSSPSAGITLTGCGSTGTGACASSISQIRYQTDAGNNGMGIYVTTTGVTPQFQLGKPDGTTLAWQDMPLTATTGLFLWAQAGQPRGTYTLSVRPANEPGSVCTYSFSFGATNADAILYPTGNSGGTGTGTNNGTGLLGTYFNSVDLTSSPVLSRVDATINFTWDAAGPSPASGVNPTNMSVRWEGQVEAPVTGTYTFKTNNDDATRLWINGQQLINDWPGGHPPTVYQGTISLQAGQKYTIKYEFNQGGGGAQAQLSWSYPGQAEQIVPQGRLYPGSGGSTGTGACASSISQIRYQTDAGNNGMGIYVTTTGVTPQFQLGKPDGTTLAWQDMPLTATTGLFLWAQAGQPRGTYTLSVRPANEPGSVCTYSFNFGATNADAILYPTGNSGGTLSKSYQRVIIIGNSITFSDTSSAINWNNRWGMAASAENKDFVHILTDKLRQVNPTVAVEIKNIAYMEGGYATNNYDSVIDGFVNTFKPDLIIMRIAENVDDASVYTNNFEGFYKSVIERLSSYSSTNFRVVCSTSFFSGKDNVDYIIKKVASSKGYPVAEINTLAGDSQYQALSFPNPAVRTHPNDLGMQKIADLIWNKILLLPQ